MDFYQTFIGYASWDKVELIKIGAQNDQMC